METKQATVGITLDTRRPKADGVYPVKLRIIHQRHNRLYSTVYSLTKDEFERLPTSKTKKLKDIRNDLSALQTKARNVIDQLPAFSFPAFRSALFPKSNETNDPKNVYSAFDVYIKDMEQQNRVGNAIAYKCALTSLQKHRPKLTFEQVTVKFLKDYAAAMIAQGNTLTTIGIYLRCLRAILNIAKNNGIISAEAYPFTTRKDDKKFKIKAPKGRPRALDLPEIKKIFIHSPATDSEAMYRDLWIFSYLCNGANMKDICLLKFSNIEGDTITFYREKTKNTDSKPDPIVADYTDKLRDIVSRWGNSPAPGAFLFPILQTGDNERRIKERVAQVVKLVNKYIKRVAEAEGIETNVTTYTARHSFATTLRNAGVNVSFISESMGHSDTKTTENYLAKLKDNSRKEIASKLTDF